ncbi:MAG: TerB family tellurite resistance protein [Gammaproteobacteria bacterium]|nr:TerB family tellurite resistance protein [Gammaproteobacteria bacterium]
MWAKLRQWFHREIKPHLSMRPATPMDQTYGRLAVAVLLTEVASADLEYEIGERDLIIDGMVRVFGISRDKAVRLVGRAKEIAGDAASRYAFVSELNDRYSHAQKLDLLEMLWQIAFADGRLDKYEEKMIKRLVDKLYLSYKDFEHAKHRAHGEVAAQ